MSSLGDFSAADLDEQTKKECVQQIEKGMSYCDNCSTTDTDNKSEMCMKHLKMYGRLYP